MLDNNGVGEENTWRCHFRGIWIFGYFGTLVFSYFGIFDKFSVLIRKSNNGQLSGSSVPINHGPCWMSWMSLDVHVTSKEPSQGTYH